MDLDSVTRSEVSQKERNNYHILRNTCGIFKNDSDEPVCRAGIGGGDIENGCVNRAGGKEESSAQHSASTHGGAKGQGRRRSRMEEIYDTHS